MPRYDPRTHVFDYGAGTPKETREGYVLDEFCKHMRTRYKASYRVIPMHEALRRGLVIATGGSTVDGVLNTSRSPVAIELLGYSPVKDRGDVMGRDLQLRKKIKATLYEQLRAKHLSLSLVYGERRRPGPKFGTIRTVPPTKKFGTVTEELQMIVKLLPQIDLYRFLFVDFVKAEIAKRWGMRRGVLYLDKTRFPICAAHFSRLEFFRSQDSLPIDVSSDLSAGYIGFDVDWVQQHVAEKAHKSLHKSRERANGLSLWLIIHSGGKAIHQMIPEISRPYAMEICQETLAATEHGFSRVYWADRTGLLDAAWVGRVQ